MMQMTKIAAAITLSAGLLVGCNGPELVQEPVVTPPAPTSALTGAYWDISESGAAAATASATDLPNVYVFDGDKTQNYYNDDATPGTYKIYPTTYSENLDDGTIEFTYYDATGAATPVTGTYSVTSGALTIDTASYGELAGADQVADTAITTAVKAANDEAGLNNSVQIHDTYGTDTGNNTGELRLKLSDSAVGAAETAITSGKLTVDFIYQVDEDTEQEANGEGDNSYISFYASGTSKSNLHGEIILSEGKVQYRNANGDITEAIGDESGIGSTFTPGDKLAIEAMWDDGKFTFTVNGESFTGEVADNTPVQVIALRLGDNGNTTNYEVIADNLKVYSNDVAADTLIFEDDFDSYSVGQVLGSPYNSNSSEATVIGNSNSTDPVEPGDFPSAVHEFKFNNGDATTDSGTAASSNTKWTGNATLTSTAGSTGSDATAIDVDQDTAGYGYAYYTADGTTGADQIEGSFSIETVINRDRANTSDVALVDYADTSNYLGYKLYIESTDDTLKFKVYGGVVDESNLSTEAVSSVSIMDDKWYHVAAVYNDVASEATIYLNGALVATKSVDWDLAKNSGDKFILLGGATSSDKNFDGQVDNIGLWNVALTAEQVAERVTQFSAQ